MEGYNSFQGIIFLMDSSLGKYPHSGESSEAEYKHRRLVLYVQTWWVDHRPLVTSLCLCVWHMVYGVLSFWSAVGHAEEDGGVVGKGALEDIMLLICGGPCLIVFCGTFGGRKIVLQWGWAFISGVKNVSFTCQVWLVGYP